MIPGSRAALLRSFIGAAAAAGVAIFTAGACQSKPALSPASAIDVRGEESGLPGAGVSEAPASRHPDGALMDTMPAALPVATDRAEARGVVALREPIGTNAIRAVVAAVAEAWQRESPEALGDLLTPDAGPIEGRSRGSAALVEGWRQRLHAHEYGRLAGVELVRLERIERYDWDDLSAPGAPPRPLEMRRDEVYVRVPIEVTHVGGERLFGDLIVLLLRREERRYKVAAYGEVDAP